jgi:hypothetical protein
MSNAKSDYQYGCDEATGAVRNMLTLMQVDHVYGLWQQSYEI